MKIYNKITRCKVCKSEKLTDLFQIPEQFLSPTFVKSNKNNPLSKIKVPMTIDIFRIIFIN